MRTDLTNVTTEDWARIKDFFDTVTELEPGQRMAYLDTVPAALRGQVEYLLEGFNAGTQVGAAIDTAAARTLDARLPEAGERLGPYRIIQIIGRGGMSVVYRAVRADDAYQQAVAIKAAALGVHSPELLKRFLAERQILANLEHPNITRLMDGGTTAEGIPYVVMELISGKPIDAWCDEKHLDRRQRIQLMVEVARAVSYAHQHLVVHRDLKPDNIFVNDEGIPKLLDFGIAKALDPQELQGNGSMTIDTTRLMTPDYASPEQLRGEPVTTATDVYQLGVVLYLLLTGKRPFKSVTGRMAELEHAICELPPPKPNLDRDLDLAILKALEKDPARRYASAGELADDLERYLKGFPTNAQAAPWSYRAKKFALRNKLAAGAASTLLLLLVAFTALLLVQNRQVKHQRDVAQANLHRAEQISSFMQDVFSSADPNVNNGNPPSLPQLVDQGIAKADASLASEPEVHADLLTTFGETYAGLGQYERSDAVLTRALALYRSLHEEHTARYLQCLSDDADVAPRHGDKTRGIAEARESVDLSTSLSGLYSEPTANALDTLTFNLLLADDRTETEATARKDIAIWEKIGGPDTPRLFAAMNSLAGVLEDDYRDTEAEAFYRRELSILQRDPKNDNETSDALNRFGTLLSDEGRYNEAEPLLRQGLALRIKVFGAEHVFVGLNQNRLAVALFHQGKFPEAETLLLQALALHLKALGPVHRYVASDQMLLGEFYETRGDLARAEQYYRQSLEVNSKLYGPSGLRTASSQRALGHLLIARAKLDEAGTLLQAALHVQESKNGADHPQTAFVLLSIGQLQLAQHQAAAAEATLRKTLDIYRRKAPERQPVIATALELLAETLEEEHHYPEARQLLAEAVAIRQKELNPEAPDRRKAEAMLAKAEQG